MERDTPQTGMGLITEAVPDTEDADNIGQTEGFEEVFHTSPDASESSLAEGIRHRSSSPQT